MYFYYRKIIFSDIKDLDIILSAVTIEDYLWEVARSQWHYEEYNLCIISGLFTQTSNVWQMMNIFDSIIWCLIFGSILSLTFYSKLNNSHKEKTSKQGILNHKIVAETNQVNW